MQTKHMNTYAATMVVAVCELASPMSSACPSGALVSSVVKESLRCTVSPGAAGGSVLALEDAWRWRLLSGAEGIALASEPSRLFELFRGPTGNPELPLLASGNTKPFIAVFVRSLRVGGSTACVRFCNPRLASTSSLSRTALSYEKKFNLKRTNGMVAKGRGHRSR